MPPSRGSEGSASASLHGQEVAVELTSVTAHSSTQARPYGKGPQVTSAQCGLLGQVLALLALELPCAPRLE